MRSWSNNKLFLLLEKHLIAFELLFSLRTKYSSWNWQSHRFVINGFYLVFPKSEHDQVLQVTRNCFSFLLKNRSLVRAMAISRLFSRLPKKMSTQSLPIDIGNPSLSGGCLRRIVILRANLSWVSTILAPAISTMPYCWNMGTSLHGACFHRCSFVGSSHIFFFPQEHRWVALRGLMSSAASFSTKV